MGLAQVEIVDEDAELPPPLDDQHLARVLPQGLDHHHAEDNGEAVEARVLEILQVLVTEDFIEQTGQETSLVRKELFWKRFVCFIPSSSIFLDVVSFC